MTKKTVLILLFILVFSSFISICHPTKAGAHRSGCHRWHSCPSDTGSYTCGDTGHPNYCGTSSTYTPPVNYRQQGLANGKQHANTDAPTIQARAREAGTSAGRGAGNAGSPNAPSPSVNTVCDISFTFQGSTTQDYRNGYHDGYFDACASTYADSYRQAYQSSYTQAYAEFQSKPKVEAASTTLATAEKPKNAKPNYDGWIWGGVAVLFIAAVAAANKSKD